VARPGATLTCSGCGHVAWMNVNVSLRGVGTSKIRRLVATGRNDAHTVTGTVNGSSPASSASNLSGEP
jgi:hypothetical protein